MRPPTSYRSARELPWLFGLSIALWIAGPLIAAYGAWQLSQGFPWEGISTLTTAVALFTAGVGLYQIRSWGPMLFALFTMRIEVELVDFVRDSIPAVAKNGPYELAGTILSVIFMLVLVGLTVLLAYQIMGYTQTQTAWRPSKRILRSP